ncbi:uncharacterized protein LOC119690219 [Teleopsis dalmanni]|uniref:uncharacterized protein LOC119690219 n=1 Tax=Teleopsis dalmanni TaxID=139649 RepID=UPI0018CF9F7A|nr:uncharacterized protein LOC119690219 [Teleopsis dalmanni]XP_037961161.1 uncharacterized protein LOC119690219 [Teleopsis dalmanni]
MKYFAFCTVFLLIVAVFILDADASYCPCDLSQKGQSKVCGSNGVTYANRCEFECAQKEYTVLKRKLNIAKMGQC